MHFGNHLWMIVIHALSLVKIYIYLILLHYGWIKRNSTNSSHGKTKITTERFPVSLTRFRNLRIKSWTSSSWNVSSLNFNYMFQYAKSATNYLFLDANVRNSNLFSLPNTYLYANLKKWRTMEAISFRDERTSVCFHESHRVVLHHENH